MAINVSALNSTLQTKIDALDAATDTKEVLLLSKALDAAAGSTSVSDVLAEGVVQVNNVNAKGAEKVAEVNALATSTLKTVGGESILGSGDIATLPSGGSAGQVVKKNSSNNPVWADDAGYDDTSTQLWGQVLSSPTQCGSVNSVLNATVTLSEPMTNFKFITFIYSNWANHVTFPVSMLRNQNMPSDTTGSSQILVATYDTYHAYVRYISDTQIYFVSGSGIGFYQIWGTK